MGFPALPQVLPGQYAFVLHTASPFSGARGEMYGEMVCGLGETLVGNHPGRPLAFSDRPDGSDMQLLALPSKRQGLFVPAEGTLIARSDTNGEDLDGYAGAGLYDRCARLGTSVAWSLTALACCVWWWSCQAAGWPATRL